MKNEILSKVIARSQPSGISLMHKPVRAGALQVFLQDHHRADENTNASRICSFRVNPSHAAPLYQSHCTRLWRVFEDRISKIPRDYTYSDFSGKAGVGIWGFGLVSGFFGGKENRKILNTNALQFSAVHCVPNIYNLGFYFYFSFAEVKLGGKKWFVCIDETHANPA